MTAEETRALDDVLKVVGAEVVHGRQKHGVFKSYFDGWARLTGEVDELAQAVLHDTCHSRPRNIRDEAMQVAAMAVRLVLEVDE